MMSRGCSVRGPAGGRGPRAADLEHMMAASGDRHRLHTDAAYAQQAGFAAPLLHGPFGIAAFLGWFHESGIGADTVIGMLDSNWRYLGPVVVGGGRPGGLAALGWRVLVPDLPGHGRSEPAPDGPARDLGVYGAWCAELIATDRRGGRNSP